MQHNLNLSKISFDEVDGNPLRLPRAVDISQEAMDAMDEAKQIERQYQIASSSGKNSLSSSLRSDNKIPKLKFPTTDKKSET